MFNLVFTSNEAYKAVITQEKALIFIPALYVSGEVSDLNKLDVFQRQLFWKMESIMMRINSIMTLPIPNLIHPHNSPFGMRPFKIKLQLISISSCFRRNWRDIIQFKIFCFFNFCEFLIGALSRNIKTKALKLFFRYLSPLSLFQISKRKRADTDSLRLNSAKLCSVENQGTLISTDLFPTVANIRRNWWYLPSKRVILTNRLLTSITWNELHFWKDGRKANLKLSRAQWFSFRT